MARGTKHPPSITFSFSAAALDDPAPSAAIADERAPLAVRLCTATGPQYYCAYGTG
uniref:hypothetical protein n=1 Tax=Cupriavidus yeoncheonensis TaxID=1462994 RepID=UPI003F498611